MKQDDVPKKEKCEKCGKENYFCITSNFGLICFECYEKNLIINMGEKNG